MKNTAVNAECLRAFLNREAKVRNFPPHHRAHIVINALHMYWIPTPEEKELARVESSYYYTNEVNFLQRKRYYKRSSMLPAWFPFNLGKGFELKESNA